jgi:hypothetical protein
VTTWAPLVYTSTITQKIAQCSLAPRGLVLYTSYLISVYFHLSVVFTEVLYRQGYRSYSMDEANAAENAAGAVNNVTVKL